MNYGFIGLGHLGGKLAGSLMRGGFPLVVCDLDREAVGRLVAEGAQAAATPAEVASRCDAVVTCLPSPAASARVLEGPGGLLEGAREGLVWIEMSTNDRDSVQRMAAAAARKGIATLECPCTGGVHLAGSGGVAIMVGGEAALLERCRPALETMGRRVFHVGPIGSAAVIKVITNMLAFVHLVAAGEALMLAKRGGIDLARAYEIIRASSGNSFVHETESQLILNGSYNINFTFDLACKDLGFAMKLGRDFGVPLDLAALTAQTFIRAREAYGGAAWSTKVVKLLEDALHTDLRATGFPAEL